MKRKNWFGKRLRDYRESSMITQRQLAKVTGINECYISFIETGRRPNPSLSTVMRLSKGLKTTVSILIGEK